MGPAFFLPATESSSRLAPGELFSLPPPFFFLGIPPPPPPPPPLPLFLKKGREVPGTFFPFFSCALPGGPGRPGRRTGRRRFFSPFLSFPARRPPPGPGFRGSGFFLFLFPSSPYQTHGQARSTGLRPPFFFPPYTGPEASHPGRRLFFLDRERGRVEAFFSSPSLRDGNAASMKRSGASRPISLPSPSPPLLQGDIDCSRSPARDWGMDEELEFFFFLFSPFFEEGPGRIKPTRWETLLGGFFFFPFFFFLFPSPRRARPQHSGRARCRLIHEQIRPAKPGSVFSSPPFFLPPSSPATCRAEGR